MLRVSERVPLTKIPLNRLAVIAAIIGIGTGLFVAALNWSAIGVERLVYGADHLHNQNPNANVSPLRLSITVVVLSIFASWAWFIVHRTGQKEVSIVGAMRGTKMPILETIASAFLQVTTVAAGAPVGAENAPRIAGALVGERFSRWLQLDIDAKRILVASAAGAGLGASFHLPLAGVLFALEILLVEASTRTVVIAIITTTAAVATTGFFVQTPDVFTTVPLTESPWMLLSAMVTGVVAGICGHWFSIIANKMAQASPKGSKILWQMPLGFLTIATVIYFFPVTLANPRWLADTMLGEGLLLSTILLILALRTAMLLLAFRVGMVGGNLIPSFALGAMVGGVVGTFLEPITNVPIAAFALLGAAAFLSTTMAAPLFGLIAAVEFTDMEAQGYLPIFLAVASAVLAVRVWSVISKREFRAIPITYASWTGELK
ncbi:chloride channel protein [Corynebacterium crudilactis]|uniref:Chloride channel protein n=1 Tax=Corynebacterium crudilactis TaxID=1652495 RepID=A0A172QQ54_9CORY|nr:chloride channel protein [Corynebacterium crudilactis]ANE02825.1 chloride channel protein [Corynebacterium crudilactis]